MYQSFIRNLTSTKQSRRHTKECSICKQLRQPIPCNTQNSPPSLSEHLKHRAMSNIKTPDFTLAESTYKIALMFSSIKTTLSLLLLPTTMLSLCVRFQSISRAERPSSNIKVKTKTKLITTIYPKTKPLLYLLQLLHVCDPPADFGV